MFFKTNITLGFGGLVVFGDTTNFMNFVHCIGFSWYNLSGIGWPKRKIFSTIVKRGKINKTLLLSRSQASFCSRSQKALSAGISSSLEFIKPSLRSNSGISV